MSTKFLAGAVASMLALTPTVASAAGSHQQPAATGNNGSKQPSAWQCSGRASYSCPGYQYQCEELNLGPSFWGFTNSDATEDYYEAFPAWTCYGD